MANPFGITQVDIPGVFGDVGQFKQNALNLQIGEEKLNAFRQSQETESQLRSLRPKALAGEKGALGAIFQIDPTEGKATLDFLVKGKQETRDQATERRTQAAVLTRKLARLSAQILQQRDLQEGDQIPEEFIQEARTLKIPEEQIPKIVNRVELEGFVFQSQQFAKLLDEANQGALPFVRVTDEGKQEVATAIPGSAKARLLEEQGFTEASKFSFKLEGGGLSPTGLTKPQIGAQKIKLEEALVQTVDVLKLSQRTIELLETPDAPAKVGIVAAAARTIDSVIAQFHGAGILLGKDRVTPQVVKDFEGRTTPDGRPLFGSFAAESVRIKTNLIRLTSILAVLNNDGARPSDFDQRRADLMAAITSGSPGQMRAALEEIEEQAIGRFKTRFDAEQIRLFPDDPEKRKVFNAESTFGDFGITLPSRLGAQGPSEFQTVLQAQTLQEFDAAAANIDFATLTQEEFERLEERRRELGG